MIIFIALAIAVFVLLGKTTVKVHDDYYNRDVNKITWKLNKKTVSVCNSSCTGNRFQYDCYYSSQPCGY